MHRKILRSQSKSCGSKRHGNTHPPRVWWQVPEVSPLQPQETAQKLNLNFLLST